MKPRIVKKSDPPVRVYETLELEGVEYKLCYDYRSIAMAEREAGTDSLFEDFLKSMTVNEDDQVIFRKLPSSLSFAALFYAALKPAQPHMTLDSTMDLIKPLTNRMEIFTAIAKAWFASTRDPIAPASEDGAARGERAAG